MAWAVLLVTVATWWLLDSNGSAGHTHTIGQASVQDVQQTSAPQVSAQAKEGLAWNVHQ